MSGLREQTLGDTLIFYVRQGFRIRNRGLREGYIQECKAAPLGVGPMPIVSIGKVDRSPIGAWESRIVDCEITLKFLAAKLDSTPRLQVVYLDGEGKQIVDGVIYFPPSNECSFNYEDLVCNPAMRKQ
jgi:hypothetical protein